MLVLKLIYRCKLCNVTLAGAGYTEYKNISAPEMARYASYERGLQVTRMAGRFAS